MSRFFPFTKICFNILSDFSLHVQKALPAHVFNFADMEFIENGKRLVMLIHQCIPRWSNLMWNQITLKPPSSFHLLERPSTGGYQNYTFQSSSYYSLFCSSYRFQAPVIVCCDKIQIEWKTLSRYYSPIALPVSPSLCRWSFWWRRVVERQGWDRPESFMIINDLILAI